MEYSETFCQALSLLVVSVSATARISVITNVNFPLFSTGKQFNWSSSGHLNLVGTDVTAGNFLEVRKRFVRCRVCPKTFMRRRHSLQIFFSYCWHTNFYELQHEVTRNTLL